MTATESARWVLDGHYLKQETIVDLGEAIPSIAVMTFTGWDNETQGYVSFQASNDGSLGSVETLIPDDETILSARIRLGEGQLVVERGVTKLANGTYRFATQTALHGAAPSGGRPHLRGWRDYRERRSAHVGSPGPDLRCPGQHHPLGHRHVAQQPGCPAANCQVREDSLGLVSGR